MAKYQYVPGSRRPRPGYRGCQKLCLVLALLVGGCVLKGYDSFGARPAPEVSPLPYRFQIVSFADQRPAATDVRQNAVFQQDVFLRALQEKLRYNLFGATPASLKLALTHYAFSHFKKDYTLSMGMHMQAKSSSGKIMVDEGFSCVVDHFEDPTAIITRLEQLGENPQAFTTAGWQARIRKQMLRKCADTLVASFGQAVIRGTPAQGE
jgi:hypothetical protein